jgi:hypothetical protein
MEAAAAAETTRKRRRISITDSIVAVVIIVFIVVLSKTLIGQLSLHHEVSSARVITDAVVVDLQKQDAKSAHSLGDTGFQASYSTAQLQSLFKATQPFIVGSSTITKQIVSNGSAADAVAVIYRYGSQKPYYVQVIARKIKHSSTWQLYGISGNASQAKLTKF